MSKQTKELLLTMATGPFGFRKALGWRHFYMALACYVPSVVVVTMLITPSFRGTHAALQLLVSALLAIPAVSLPLCLCLVRAEKVLQLVQSLPQRAGGKAHNPLRSSAAFSLFETGCILLAWCLLLASARITEWVIAQPGDPLAQACAIAVAVLFGLDIAGYIINVLVFHRRHKVFQFGSRALSSESKAGDGTVSTEPVKQSGIGPLCLVFGPFGYLCYSWRKFITAAVATAGLYATALIPINVWVQYVEIGKATVTHQFGPYGEYGVALLMMAFLGGLAIFAGAAFCAGVLLAAYTARLSGIERRLRNAAKLPQRQAKRAKTLADALVFVELLLLGTILPAGLVLAAAMLLDIVAYFDGSQIWLVALPLAISATAAAVVVWVALSLVTRRLAGVSFFPFATKHADSTPTPQSNKEPLA